MATHEPLKKAVPFCTCRGACPGMSKIDFWKLAERVRLKLGDRIEFMALHPRLCEPDGDRFMAHIRKEGILFFTPACKKTKQEKLLCEGFAASGVPMDNI